VANNSILITGCQRSGTTLMHLILNSHPEIVSIDEAHYIPNQHQNYLNNPDYGPNVAFKLPTTAHNIKSLTQHRGKIIWMLRDPRDVVCSMLKLVINAYNVKCPWACHPAGSGAEIYHSASTICEYLKEPLESLLQDYYPIAVKPTEIRNRHDAIVAGALCWELKNRLLQIYQQEGIDFHLLSYDALIASPQTVLLEVVEYLELPWNDDMLRHHQLHNGMSTGNTDNTRPIDPKNNKKWQSFFSDEEVELVMSYCAATAKRCGLNIFQ
jgi:hypothetical protein